MDRKSLILLAIILPLSSYAEAGPDYTLLNWLTNLSSRTNFIRLWMIYINQ